MQSESKLSRNTRVLAINYFLTGLIFVGPIWVSFERRLITAAQMTALEAIGTTILVVMQLPTGAVADLVGRKTTIIFGWLLAGTAWIFFGLSNSFWQLVVAYSLANFGTAFVSGADTALLFDSLKELGRAHEFKKFVSRNSLFFQWALVPAIIIGGYAYNINVVLPYVLFGTALILGAISCFWLTEPDIDSERFTLKSYLRKNRDGFKEIFKTADVKLLSLFYIGVGGLTWSTQVFFNQVLATDVGWSEIEKGWIFAGLRLINSIIIYKIVMHHSLITRKRSFLMFPILMLIAFLPAFFADKYFAIFLIWLAVFAATSRFNVLNQYMNEEFESRHRATALSTLSMFVSIVYIFVMLVSGPVMQQTGSRLVYSSLGVLTLIFVLPLGIMLYRKQDKLNSVIFQEPTELTSQKYQEG